SGLRAISITPRGDTGGPPASCTARRVGLGSPSLQTYKACLAPGPSRQATTGAFRAATRRGCSGRLGSSRVLTCFLVATSHWVMGCWFAAVSSQRLSEEKQAVAAGSDHRFFPFAGSHSLTSPSSPSVAMYLPSGLYCTRSTWPSCPARV